MVLNYGTVTIATEIATRMGILTPGDLWMVSPKSEKCLGASQEDLLSSGNYENTIK